MKTPAPRIEPVTVLRFPTSVEVPEPNTGLYRKQREFITACVTVLALIVATIIVGTLFKTEAFFLSQTTLIVLIFTVYKYFPRWKKTVDEVHPILHISAKSIAAVSSRNKIEFDWDTLDYIEPSFLDELPALQFGSGEKTFYAPESMPNYAWFNFLVFQLVVAPAGDREAILLQPAPPDSELPPPQEHWRRIPYVRFSDTYGE